MSSLYSGQSLWRCWQKCWRGLDNPPDTPEARQSLDAASDEEAVLVLRAAAGPLQDRWRDPEPRTWKGLKWSAAGDRVLGLDLSDYCCPARPQNCPAWGRDQSHSPPCKLRLGGRRRLAALPAEVGLLRALTTLQLNNSHVAILPPEIGQLRALNLLNLLNCSHLTSLPDEIGSLRALTTLGLSGCPIQLLPRAIGRLHALTTLDLYNCPRLADLPAELGHLRAVTSLGLGGCTQLGAARARLPPEVGRLRTLTSLDLCDCRNIAHLGEIGNLRALAVLCLSGCSQLKTLPPEIGRLGALQCLDLGGCSQLCKLPAAIGRLRALTELDLSYCPRLRKLPPEIRRLRALTIVGFVEDEQPGGPGAQLCKLAVASFSSVRSLDSSVSIDRWNVEMEEDGGGGSPCDPPAWSHWRCKERAMSATKLRMELEEDERAVHESIESEHHRIASERRRGAAAAIAEALRRGSLYGHVDPNDG